MKKFMVCFIVLGCLTAMVFGQSPCGDVDNNGRVTIIDANIIIQYFIFGTSPVDPFDESKADVNADGVVNTHDALLVAQYYVDVIPDLDCCCEDPVARNDVTKTVKEVPIACDVLANDDGESLEIINITGHPANGNAVIDGNIIWYDPATGFTGKDSFVYEVENIHDSRDIALVSVEVIEPIAVDDIVYTGDSTGINIDVLANDLLSGNTAEITGVTGPANGTAVINEGKIYYTPDSGFIGTDTFIYNIKYRAIIDTGTVSVTVTKKLADINFQDTNLRHCINNSGCSFVHELKTLACPNKDIVILSGIEECIFLEKLVLTDNNISDLGPLGNLELLEILDLEHNNIIDISPIVNLPCLETLVLAHNPELVLPQANTNGFMHMKELTYVNLGNTGVGDLNYLGIPPKLETLILSGNSLTNFSHLANLTTIINLDLTDTGITDMLPLINLSSLKVLVLANNTGLDMILPLTNLINLTYVNLNNTGITDDLFWIDIPPKLETLILSNNPITDFSHLGNLNTLISLDLTNTGINGNNLAYLSNLVNLKRLDLRRNNINTIGPLVSPHLLRLEKLDLGSNNLGNDDEADLTGMTSLRELDISRNNVNDVGFLAYPELPNLEILDLRGNMIQNNSFIIPRYHHIRKLDIVNCYPGDYRGDGNGDHLIHELDASIADSMYRSFGSDEPTYPRSYLPLPDNISIIDMDNNYIIDDNDVASIQNMTGPDENDILGFPCDTCYIKGDADGDGTVTQDDADLLENLSVEKINRLTNDRLTFENNIVTLDGMSCEDIRNHAIRREPLEASLHTPEPGVVSIVTYDQDDVDCFDPDDPDLQGYPLNVSFETIDELHADILANPFLRETDILLLYEYAYSRKDYPVILEQVGPLYEIINDNEIVRKIKELMVLAARNQLYIIVPLAEKKLYDINNNIYEVFLNTTLVINKQGCIEFLRRAKYDASELKPDSLSTKVLNDIYDSVQVMNMVTKRNDVFNAILLICAEGSSAVPEFNDLHIKITNAVAGTGKDTVDLLLHPLNAARNFLPGNEIMNQLQYRAWNPADTLPDNLQYTFNAYKEYTGGTGDVVYVDYIVYSDYRTGNQGVIKTDKQPLAYINTTMVDDMGFIYSRIKLIRPQE